MNRIILALCLLVSAVAAHAQTADTKPAPPAKTAKTAVSPEEELAQKERRSKARALLVALSSDARTSHDETLRRPALGPPRRRPRAPPPPPMPRHSAHDRSRESPTRSGKSIPNRVD